MTERLTGPTNELAKERNRAAAERTLTAWIQNAVTVIAFGATLDRVVAARAAAQPEPPGLTAWASVFALGFIGLGLFLLVLAVVQYCLEVRALVREDYRFLPVRPLTRAIALAVALFGMLGAIAIVLNALLLA